MEADDKFISGLMKDSSLQMPFGDFEETVMQQIREEAKLASLVRRDKKVSIIFFIAGTILGLLVNVLLTTAKYELTEYAGNMLQIFQLVFVACFLIQAERVFRFTKWFERT